MFSVRLLIWTPVVCLKSATFPRNCGCVAVPSFFDVCYTKETGNRNATAISENCNQPDLNTLLNVATQLEESALPVFLVCPRPKNFFQQY
jgi:hypothetical protein